MRLRHWNLAGPLGDAVPESLHIADLFSLREGAEPRGLGGDRRLIQPLRRTCEEGARFPVLPPAPSSSDPGSSQVLGVFSQQYLGTFITVSGVGYKVVRESHRTETGSIAPQRRPRRREWPAPSRGSARLRYPGPPGRRCPPPSACLPPSRNTQGRLVSLRLRRGMQSRLL